ncbi:hypothetical protein DRE_04358 [Drechslerella stenobrocha 248]|uniref:Peptidase A1 domain-containing protein n=1 Tax=Drechslerella stenobrocha 248 TaxID=1043628 RepID=W7IBD6_9PEZI|nr:hypothetical protein DRE_04358 [Drechslerella stenobrocha 248]
MGRSSFTAVRWYSIPAFLSASLLLSYFVIHHSQDTQQLFGRSFSSEKERRNEGKYVVMPVRFSRTLVTSGEIDPAFYTDVRIGTDNQNISMAVSLEGTTWVPEKPGSLTTFCSNSTNAPGCRAAAVSGYYTPPSDVDRDDPFKYSSTFTTNDENATAFGYWTEGPITIAGVSTDIQFGVAQYWNAAPVLGLGLTSNSSGSSSRPGYIQSLMQQGRILGTYCGIYDSGDAKIGGEILFGGVDRSKFTGRLKIWNLNAVGEISSPTAQYITESYRSPMVSVRGNSSSSSVIAAGVPGACIPAGLMTEIWGLTPSKAPDVIYDIPCNFFEAGVDYIELTWDDLVIKIDLVDFVYPIPGSVTPSCFVSLLPCAEGDGYDYIFGQPFFKSAYVVMDPGTKRTAIGLSNRNMTNSTIVELGGSVSSGLSEIEGIDPSPIVQPDSSPSPDPNASPAPTDPPSSGSSTNVGAIAGGVVGGVAVLGAIGAFFFFRQRKSAKQAKAPPTDAETGPVVGELDGSKGISGTYKSPAGGDSGHPQGQQVYAEMAGHPVASPGVEAPLIEYAELPGNPMDGGHNSR